MTESPRERAVDYLKTCAAIVAPRWAKSYNASMPPQEVLDFFDESVSNVVNAEPYLAGYFGIYRNRKERLTSELLDILIAESRLEVDRILAEKSREQREAADIRLAAIVAKEERYANAVQEALRKTPNLVNSHGTITQEAMDELVVELAAAIASRWHLHGGQRIGGVFRSFIRSTVRAFLRDVRLDDGTWDVRLEDGTLRRRTSLENEAESYGRELGHQIWEEAMPHFTYEEISPWEISELRGIALDLLEEKATSYATASKKGAELIAAANSLERWQQLHPAPPASPYGVSPAGAEKWCCDWLTHMGLRDATVTQISNDGGIDVISPTHIAQVKHYANNVSIAELREFVGVAHVSGHEAIFMTSGRYPVQAEAYANSAGMLLFHYDVETALVTGCTAASRDFMESGFF